MRGIVKSFPGVRALDGVSLSVARGEVHALVGENGAGKSTLMKILAGAYRADAGTISLDGSAVLIDSPRQAEELGIGMIYQEFNLVPEFDATRNIVLGVEPGRGPFLDERAATAKAAAVMQEFGIVLPPGMPARLLSVAQQQMVEICKALVKKARLVVMDEPTASLSNREIDALFALIRRLKAQGVAFVYISHRLEELPAIADRITVLRDGRAIVTERAAALTQEDIIRFMVGRPLQAQFPDLPAPGEAAPIVLEVEGLRTAAHPANISFRVRRGEIVGLSGLVGAGRTEIVRAIAGADVPVAGTIRIDGRRVIVGNPSSAIRAGIAFITEDRKAQGLVLDMNVRQNTTLAHLELFARHGFIDAAAETRVTSHEIAELHIRTPSGEQVVRNLSGGNQQKVVLAKWLIAQASVFLFDEPTRGIDVGAKAEIYGLMVELLRRGAAIVMVSSELPEVLGMAHRVLVVRDGAIRREFSHTDVTAEGVMAVATGVEP